MVVQRQQSFITQRVKHLLKSDIQFKITLIIISINIRLLFINVSESFVSLNREKYFFRTVLSKCSRTSLT